MMSEVTLVALKMNLLRLNTFGFIRIPNANHAVTRPVRVWNMVRGKQRCRKGSVQLNVGSLCFSWLHCSMCTALRFGTYVDPPTDATLAHLLTATCSRRCSDRPQWKSEPEVAKSCHHAAVLHTSLSAVPTRVTQMNLTLTLLTWTIWRAHSNASKWRMGFNSAFKGLKSKNIWLYIHNYPCGRIKEQLHWFLTPTLFGGASSASQPSQLTPGEKLHHTYRTQNCTIPIEHKTAPYLSNTKLHHTYRTQNYVFPGAGLGITSYSLQESNQ